MQMRCFVCWLRWPICRVLSHTDRLQKFVASLVTQVRPPEPQCCVNVQLGAAEKDNRCAGVCDRGGKKRCVVSAGGTNVSTNRRKRKRVQESSRVPASPDLGVSANQIPVMVSSHPSRSWQKNTSAAVALVLPHVGSVVASKWRKHKLKDDSNVATSD